MNRMRTHVPQWATSAVQERGIYTVPPLIGIIESPVLLTDGSVLVEEGYHSPSGLFYSPTIKYPPLMDPHVARDMLGDVFADFPLKSQADLSACIAATLTPFARFALDGPVPLNLINGNVPGCGKNMLVDVMATTFSGHPMTKMAEVASDDEMRKRIFALARAGDLQVVLDNLTREMRFPSLDAALTSTTFSDRVLGESTTLSVPLNMTWYATANNLNMSRDTARRTLHIRLESPLERPDQRTGFKYPNLLQHVKEHRGELAMAALSILHRYCAAGRPDMGLPPWGSFEAWSDLVRNAVVWVGLDDPGATRLALVEEADTDGQLLKMLIAGWDEADPHRYGLTTADAIAASEMWDTEQDCPKCPTLRAAIGELGGGANKRHALGLALRNFRSRVCGESKFDSTIRGKVNAWRIANVN